MVIPSGKWSARWAKRCLGSGGSCVSRVGSLRFRGSAGPPARRAAPMRLTVPDLIGNLAILVALRIGFKVLLVPE